MLSDDAFRVSQGVQAPVIKLDMSWLSVGHVDEIFALIPFGDGFKVLVADTTCALGLLEDLNIEDSGLTSASSADTLVDTSENWAVDQWKDGIVRIVSGTGSNQVRQVSGNTADTLTTILPWTIPPGTNSEYQVIARSSYRSLFIEGEEDLGVVSSVTSTTLTDTTKNWIPDCWTDGYVEITSESGQFPYKIQGNTTNSLILDTPWDIRPSSSSIYVIIEESKQWLSGQQEYSAFKTVRNFFTESNGARTNFNNACQMYIDIAIGTLTNQLQITESDIIKVPSLFYTRSQQLALAYLPNMVNLLVDSGNLVVAKPFGPKRNGTDVFEADLRNRLNSFTLHFVDDWDFYHRSEGEIHCGTNTRNSPHAINWWE